MTTINNMGNERIKSIWLVGASTGIGASLVKALDQENTQIFVSSRNLSKINLINYKDLTKNKNNDDLKVLI